MGFEPGSNQDCCLWRLQSYCSNNSDTTAGLEDFFDQLFNKSCAEGKPCSVVLRPVQNKPCSFPVNLVFDKVILLCFEIDNSKKIEIKFGGIKTVNKRVENFVHQWLFLGKLVEFEHKGLTYPKIGCSDIRCIVSQNLSQPLFRNPS